MTTTESQPVDILRRAATQMRADYSDSTEAAFENAVADWLDTAGADLWAHGPLHCADGCDECDDDLWMPHARDALKVARAYLGENK